MPFSSTQDADLLVYNKGICGRAFHEARDSLIRPSHWRNSVVVTFAHTLLTGAENTHIALQSFLLWNSLLSLQSEVLLTKQNFPPLPSHIPMRTAILLSAPTSITTTGIQKLIITPLFLHSVMYSLIQQIFILPVPFTS